MTKIAIARCGSYVRNEVEGAVRKCLQELGGLQNFVSSGQKVLVKPNLLAAEPPERGVDTHPEVVRAVLLELLALGVKPLVGDSPGVGSLARVARRPVSPKSVMNSVFRWAISTRKLRSRQRTGKS